MEFEAFTFTLRLGTNETIEIAEYYLPLMPPDVADLFRSPFAEGRKITRCPKPVMEAAKLGYDQELRRYLNSPASIVLMKLPNQVCMERKACSSFEAPKCNLSSRKQGKIDFPPCFVYETSNWLMKDVMSQFLLHWSDGRYIVFTED